MFGCKCLTGTTTLDAKAPATQLEVYPNPATDVVTLTLPGNATIQSVQVTDMRGARIGGVPYGGRGELNVSALAKGIYLLQVSDGQKTFPSTSGS